MIDNNGDQQSSVDNSFLSHSTDCIISKYESIINKNISTKILVSQRTGIPAIFTDEETSYLTKKAVDSNPNASVDIETSSPELTLKKGNTEIKVKHAAAILKKMDEKYPLGVNKDSRENIFKRPFVDESIKYGLSNPTDESESLPMPIQTVNKNAYEIRELILEHAIDIVKFSSNKDITTDLMTNKVLEVAHKFYDFVENKYRKY